MKNRKLYQDELKNASLKNETKNVMDKTAKGIRWMEEQWDESKKCRTSWQEDNA
ncbi:hypothetical protein [Candidatus Spongiihabitans sp.]|uniref:hypothetical protein n=1 Tax=Candidatus Spongiihabitans sp. TaxID=3101308 RepID=UPI003C6ED139